MRPDFAQRRLRRAGARPGGSGFRQLHHGGVHAGFEHIGGGGEAGIFAAMGEIRAIAADAGGDRFTAFGVDADGARQ